MNVVDSSAWLEYFADGPNADTFAPPIQDTALLIVPTLVIFEVFKRVLQQRSEGEALQAIALLQQGRIIDLTDPLALSAARISVEHHLPMADSIILATALALDATLWTQDSDFEGIYGVRFIPKEGT
ncbi:MAG: type II toxin-antitoxin system VapC family toxin [Planctomycetota bacterium]